MGDLMLPRSFGISLLMTCFAGLSQAVPSTSPDELMGALRAKDAQIDNVKLTYKTEGTVETAGFEDWRQPGLADALQIPKEARGPQKVRHLYNEQMVVRGQNVTFIREVDPSLRPTELKPGMVLPQAYQKWSNTEGMQREITDGYVRGTSTEDLILEIRPTTPELDLAEEQRLGIEFAHGCGFSRIITNVKSATTEGQFTVVEADAKVWTRDTSTATLWIDHDLVVRKARIEARVDNVLNVLEVETSGTQTQNNLILAERGSFSRTMFPVIDGKPQGSGKNIVKTAVTFRSIEFNLTDEQYASLTDMTVANGATIMDRIAGATYIKGKQIPHDTNFNERLGQMDRELKSPVGESPSRRDAGVAPAGSQAGARSVVRSGDKSWRRIGWSLLLLLPVGGLIVLARRFIARRTRHAGNQMEGGGQQ